MTSYLLGYTYIEEYFSYSHPSFSLSQREKEAKREPAGYFVSLNFAKMLVARDKLVVKPNQ